MVSDSMQMYLVTIAREQAEQTPVPLSELSRSMSISAVSVNEMCRKLQDSGLVQYQPYKGVSLTERGQDVANNILRKHRLWEVFLVEKLGLDFEEAHDTACELEHATPNLLADHISRFLDHPSVNPQGIPIPGTDRSIPDQNIRPLSELSAGQSAVIVEMNLSSEICTYLEEQGLRPGASLEIQAAFKTSCLLRFNQIDFSLNTDLAQNIIVTTSATPLQQELSNQEENLPSSTLKEHHMKPAPSTAVRQIPLSELKKGQIGIVVHVGGKGASRRRMLDMGLVTGSEVKVIRAAPLGDPVEYSVKGYNLSLRKSEAKNIQVEIPTDKHE